MLNAKMMMVHVLVISLMILVQSNRIDPKRCYSLGFRFRGKCNYHGKVYNHNAIIHYGAFWYRCSNSRTVGPLGCLGNGIQYQFDDEFTAYNIRWKCSKEDMRACRRMIGCIFSEDVVVPVDMMIDQIDKKVFQTNLLRSRLKCSRSVHRLVLVACVITNRDSYLEGVPGSQQLLDPKNAGLNDYDRCSNSPRHEMELRWMLLKERFECHSYNSPSNKCNIPQPFKHHWNIVTGSGYWYDCEHRNLRGCVWNGQKYIFGAK